MTIEIKWILISIYFLLSTFVTVLVVRRDDLETLQKIMQSILVWLIPFIVAIAIWLFFRSEDKNDPRTNSFAKKNQHNSGSSGSYSSGASGGSD